MIEPIFPTDYVLPDITPEAFGKMLGDIKKKLGKVDLNFKAADLPSLRTALRSLTSQTQDLCRRFSAPEDNSCETDE